MKCPKCGKEVEIQNRKTGMDENGNPVYNRYAVCRDCKKMWNLDKPKTRRPDVAPAVKDKETRKIPDIKPGGAPAARPAKSRQAPESKPVARPAKIRQAQPEPKPAARPAKIRQTPAKARQKYSNIPSQAVRSKSEKAVKESYTSMLSMDPGGVAVKDRVKQKAKGKPVYRAFRIILGAFSVLCSGLFGYMGYLADFKNLSLSNLESPVMVYVALAACMLLSGVILLAAQKSNSVFAFLIPMLTSLSGTLFAFMSHSDLTVIKIYAIGCAVFTVILLVITVTSRFALNFDDEYDGEEYGQLQKSAERRRPGDAREDDFYNDDDE